MTLRKRREVDVFLISCNDLNIPKRHTLIQKIKHQGFSQVYFKVISLHSCADWGNFEEMCAVPAQKNWIMDHGENNDANGWS